MAKKELMRSLIIAALLLGGAALMRAARDAGLIDTITVTRVVGFAAGLVVAYFGNAIPKKLCSLHSIEADRHQQSALRFAGWAFTLAGLLYAGLSLLKPLAYTDTAAIVVMVAAIAISLISLSWVYAAHKLHGTK